MSSDSLFTQDMASLTLSSSSYILDSKFKLHKLLGDGLQGSVYMASPLSISDTADFSELCRRPEITVREEIHPEMVAVKIFEKEEIKHLAIKEFNIMKAA